MTMGSTDKIQICFKSTEVHYWTVEKKTERQNVLMNYILYVTVCKEEKHMKDKVSSSYLLLARFQCSFCMAIVYTVIKVLGFAII